MTMPDLTPRERALIEACANIVIAHAKDCVNLGDLEKARTAASLADMILALQSAAITLPAAEGGEAKVSVKRLTHILESAAANTDTDWRWQTAAALRLHPQWETGVIAIDAEEDDTKRMDWIVEHCTTHVGGQGFELRVWIPADVEDVRTGIDAARTKP